MLVLTVIVVGFALTYGYELLYCLIMLGLCFQFAGTVEEVKQMMMLHLDDEYRAARGLSLTPKEVNFSSFYDF